MEFLCVLSGTSTLEKQTHFHSQHAQGNSSGACGQQLLCSLQNMSTKTVSTKTFLLIHTHACVYT